MMIAPISQPLNYNMAFLHTITLNYNNYKDWRLPTNQEYINTPEIDIDAWNQLSFDVTANHCDKSGNDDTTPRPTQSVR